ncbi:adenylate/guanylate cyclase domain-containing protein [Desulfovibrio sp. OttesenSCG-928-I05]|nr:adenylate/guanylate cyclase domain-containing protein [Desulfovibrio sp. OttesenSCG-928-I05]
MSTQPKKRLRIMKKRGLSVAVISLGVIVLMLFCYIQQPRFLRMLDHKIYDALLYAGADGMTTPYPIIIDLDEASLDAYGQWPWPRYLMAELLTRLRASGVAAVGVDILLSEADRTSPRTLREDLARHLGLDVSFAGLPEELYDFDRLLAESLDRGVVLGMYCNFASGAALKKSAGPDGDDAAAPPAPDFPVSPPSVSSIVRGAPGAQPLERYIHTAGQATLPLPLFWEAAPVGMINMNPDEDGVVRRLPLIGFYNDTLYVTLALRTLMAGVGVNSVTANVGRDGLNSLRVGPFTIPVSPDGSFTVPFRGGAHTFPYYSVKDILEGTIPVEQLQGRVAFLGTSAPGLLDIRISPLERVYPGVEVHATVTDAILAGTYLRVPPWTPGAQALAIIFCGIAASLAFGFSRPRVYILVAALLLGAAFGASVYLFREGYVISPLYVALTITLLGAVLLMLRFWQEEKQKNVLRSAFSRYVAPEVVERITRLEGNIFAGEERELSIMFTDIRGFTSISEKLSPQQIVQLLNRYFTPMTALVRGNRGTLDKFIGDALMAFWNAPVEVPGHPALAVKTALEMQEKLGEINASLQEEFGVVIAMGVGVHTGKAYVGNMGSEELLNYTLIGDSVNLASRLEGLCPQFGVGIVVSAEAKNACDESIAFLPLDTLRVKGKRQPVSVFAGMRPEEYAAREQELSTYLDAYALYGRGEFAAAWDAFGVLSGKYPDAKLYALYLERCGMLRENPPSEWDGVWTLKSK